MIQLRVCEKDGAILVSTSDFVWHGIKHSGSIALTDEQFKALQKLRRGATRERMDAITLREVGA